MEDGQDFMCEVMGGDWTMAHKGVPFDGFKGVPAGGKKCGGRQFLVDWRLPLQCANYISEYSEEDAQNLCRIWIIKMQHLHDSVKGLEGPPDWHSILAALEFPAELQVWRHNVVRPSTIRRWRYVDSLVPR